MRIEFPGYYPPSEDEDAELWTSGLIVFDSGALLSLFRYSGHTRTEYLKLLTDRSDQLWIPFHVGVEYHRNRLAVLASQNNAFEEIEKSIADAEGKVLAAIGKFTRHPSLSSADLPKHLKKSSKRFRKALAEAREAHAEFAESDDGHEKTFHAVTALYEGRIGRRWTEEELSEVYKDGASRFERRIPPGYKDTGKPGDDPYGDLVIWRQIIEHASGSGLPVIFVTDDLKEDWWRIVGGKRLGARVELIDEFAAATGKPIHFYTPDRFLEAARAKGADIGDASVEEVHQVSRARLAANLEAADPAVEAIASMDRVTATIAPERLEALRQALSEIRIPDIDPAAVTAVNRALARQLAHVRVPDVDWTQLSRLVLAQIDEERDVARLNAMFRAAKRADQASRPIDADQSIEHSADEFDDPSGSDGRGRDQNGESH